MDLLFPSLRPGALMALVVALLLAPPSPLRAAEGKDAAPPDEAALKARYEKVLNALPWKKGPGNEALGSKAELKFSADYRYLDGAGATPVTRAGTAHFFVFG